MAKIHISNIQREQDQTIATIKLLSENGFVWNALERSWIRDSDKSKVDEDALNTIHESFYEAFARPLRKAINGGRPIDPMVRLVEASDGSTVTVTLYLCKSVLDKIAEI